MRLEKQNRRSCIGLLAFLVLLTAAFVWMMAGGVSSETTADDVKADIDGPAPPPGHPLPKGAAKPPVPAKRP